MVDISRFLMMTRSNPDEQQSQYLTKITLGESFSEIVLNNSEIEA